MLADDARRSGVDLEGAPLQLPRHVYRRHRVIAFILRAWIWIKARPSAMIGAVVAVAGFFYLTRPRKPPAGRSLDREQEDERAREKGRLESAAVGVELREGIAEAEAERDAAVEADDDGRFTSDDPKDVGDDIEELLP